MSDSSSVGELADVGTRKQPRTTIGTCLLEAPIDSDESDATLTDSESVSDESESGESVIGDLASDADENDWDPALTPTTTEAIFGSDLVAYCLRSKGIQLTVIFDRRNCLRRGKGLSEQYTLGVAQRQRGGESRREKRSKRLRLSARTFGCSFR